MAEIHFRLLDLPPELIGHVWDYLRYDKAAMRPICRTLLPFTRSTAFDSVSVSTAERVSLLIDLFDCAEPSQPPSETAKNLAALVKYLSVSLAPLKVVTAEFAKNLGRAVLLMRNLKDAEVEEARFIEELLAGASPGSLPALESLHVYPYDEEDYTLRLFSRDQLGNLVHVPNLHYLSITGNFPDTATLPSPPAFPAIPQITNMSFDPSGSSYTTCGPLKAFLTSLSGLEVFHLTIVDETSPNPILESLSTGLRSLTVEFCPDFDFEDHRTVIDSAIPRFTDLESLTLGGTVFSQSAAFYTLLRSHLPSLRTFEILNVDVFVVNTAPLITHLSLARQTSPTFAHLKITLYRDWYSAGIRPSKRPHRADVVDGSFSFDEVGSKWFWPEWTNGMGYDDAKKLARATQAAGVELSGAILRAIEVEEIKQFEERYLQRRGEGMSHKEALVALGGT